MLKTVGNPSTRYGDQTIIGGNLVIGTAGNGIDFSATAGPTNGTMTSELLDDYEEGDFTPSITVASPGDLNIAYSTRAGKYQKVGDRVTIHVSITTSTFTYTTAAGGITISGMPFATSSGSIGGGGGATADWRGITKAGFTQLGMVSNFSVTEFIPRMSGSGQTPASLAITDCPSGGTLRFVFSMTYLAT
jgi:hypothetical protein